MNQQFPRQDRARGSRGYALVYVLGVLAFSVYLLLDAFVIERSYSAVAAASVTQQESSPAATASLQDTSAETSEDAAAGEAADAAEYSLNEYRYLDTTIYVVDVYADDVSQIATALAKDTYGKNVTQTTSQIASNTGATVAINGDMYGSRESGYVVRNGVLYRDTVSSASQEDLVIYADGSFDIICEGDVSAQELVEAGAWQVFSFGPGLIEDGQITVSENDEVDRAMASNPRTAIGYVSQGHYVLLVADGRTSASEGLSLYELATFMRDELGVTCAYNLDGGGSSTLYIEGEVINNPTSSGRSSKERKVSDIVYFVA